jgi:Mrp family chromosome partitioning ATPase
LKTDVLDNWYILPAGDIPPNPSELIGSQRMKELLDRLSKLFDYIVVDLPPVNIVSDALAISGFITGLVLVIREDYTEKKELETCIRQLKLSNVNVLGCVMNESKNGKGSYSKYRRYKKYYKYSRYSDRYGYYGRSGRYGYYGYYGEQDQPAAGEQPSTEDPKKSKGGKSKKA